LLPPSSAAPPPPGWWWSPTCRPDAELLLLGVDAAVQAGARDAVALRRDVRHGAVEELLEATERQLPARGGLPVRSRIERNWDELVRGRRRGVPGIEGSGERPWTTTCVLPGWFLTCSVLGRSRTGTLIQVRLLRRKSQVLKVDSFVPNYQTGYFPLNILKSVK
jgi:hypothetical protein